MCVKDGDRTREEGTQYLYFGYAQERVPALPALPCAGAGQPRKGHVYPPSPRCPVQVQANPEKAIQQVFAIDSKRLARKRQPPTQLQEGENGGSGAARERGAKPTKDELLDKWKARARKYRQVRRACEGGREGGMEGGREGGSESRAQELCWSV
jgi:hypothetical protein